MANTYTQIHLHYVFAVRCRDAVIYPSWKERLHRYITAFIQNHDHKMLVINSMPDHVHILTGLGLKQALSDLMKMVKEDSSKCINDHKLTYGQFRWQEGFGAFSYAISDINTVAAYIENQEVHHHKVTFIEEYKKLLEDFEVPYDDSYIFRDLENR